MLFPQVSSSTTAGSASALNEKTISTNFKEEQQLTRGLTPPGADAVEDGAGLAVGLAGAGGPAAGAPPAEAVNLKVEFY